MGTYITNIGLLATPRGHSARRGTQQGDVTLLRNAWVEWPRGVASSPMFVM